MRPWRTLAVASLLVGFAIGAFAFFGARKSTQALGSPATAHRATAPAPGGSASSPLVNGSSDGLLLTWIDEKGDFHVEQLAADVPMIGRDVVRVIDPSKDESSDDGVVWVADLRNERADKTYAVRPMKRAAYEAIAIGRRQKLGATLLTAPDASLVPPSVPGAVAQGESEAPVLGVPRAPIILYGASWCGPCHQAAAYLRSKNVVFIEKDIDADVGAASEMQGKLAKSGMRTGSIPVIDVRGKILVGFSSNDVDAALRKSS